MGGITTEVAPDDILDDVELMRGTMRLLCVIELAGLDQVPGVATMDRVLAELHIGVQTALLLDE